MVNTEQVIKMKQLREQGKSQKEISKELNISLTSVAKYLNKLIELGKLKPTISKIDWEKI